MISRISANPSNRFPRVAIRSTLAMTFLLAIALALPPSAGAADGSLVISGTIEYTGSQGPVSAQSPILILAVTEPTLDGVPAAITHVDTNGGDFTLNVPQGSRYYLIYLLDTNGIAIPAIGDPFGASDIPLIPPQTGITLTLDDSHQIPGVRGTMTYTGSLGPVAADRPIRVNVYHNGDLTDPLLQHHVLTSNGDTYQFFLLDNPSRRFFLRAYLDLNDNDTLDDGEPFTIYNHSMGPLGDPLPQGVADVDISFGDEALPTPTPGNDAIVSGTIEYTGARGPVSADRPILVILFATPTFDGEPVAFAAVDTSGGEFELKAPAPGQYYLAYELVTGGGMFPTPGDPFGVYLNRGGPPPDPLAAPQSGLALSFDDTSVLPGVEGTVTYTGSLGPVSDQRPILVNVFRDADLTDSTSQQDFLANNGAAFSFVLLDGGSHYLMAYLDVNNNSMRDEGEPFTIYNGETTPPGDPIPEDGSMLDITFGDLPMATPTPTPTGMPATATPTGMPVTATPTSIPATATPTSMPATATPQSTATPVPASSSGCEIQTTGDFSWLLFLPLAIPVFLRRRRSGSFSR